MEDLLEGRLAELVAEIEESRLPGWAAFFENDSEAKKRSDDGYEDLLHAVRDNDEVLFDRAAKKWSGSFARVNEHLAEEYRKANDDPKLWELRHLKWMKKIVFIKFACPMGTFYLVPRRPKKKPRAKHWYTVDEMLEMLSPLVAETIMSFGQLPIRAESLSGPEGKDKHLKMDFTTDVPTIKYEFQKRGRR